MEILKKGVTLEDWKIEIECSTISSGCGARYLAKAEDVEKTTCWLVSLIYTEYGVFCPNCGKLIEISENSIPTFIKRTIIRRKKHKRT